MQRVFTKPVFRTLPAPTKTYEVFLSFLCDYKASQGKKVTVAVYIDEANYQLKTLFFLHRLFIPDHCLNKIVVGICKRHIYFRPLWMMTHTVLKNKTAIRA